MGENIVFILVKYESDFGYWEINLEQKKALFRSHDMLIPTGERIIDYSIKFNNILDFLFENWGQKHIKAIIPNRKYLFDAETPWCHWFKANVDQHDKNTVLQCQNPARVLINGHYYCAEHAGFDMTNNPQKPVNKRRMGEGLISGVKRVVG